MNARRVRRTTGLAALGLLMVACGGNESEVAAAAEEPGRVPPDVDLSIHNVPIEEIYFDTFTGTSIRLSESEPALRTRLLDAIPPIDDPVYEDIAGGAWLGDDDLVLGYVTPIGAYAYPFKILNFHEIVNDEIDGVPVLISYCPLCRSGIVYDRRLGSETLFFGNTSALYENDMVMVDRNTGSYWWQVAGRAIVGPLTGQSMVPLASTVARWSEWKIDHPETLVLSRDTGFDRPYSADSFESYAEFLEAGQFPFPVSDAVRDDRLPIAALVVGVQRGETVRAYRVDGLDSVINDTIDGQAVVVFPTGGGAAVFEAGDGDEVLAFEMRNGEIFDIETGSVWSNDGIALEGRLVDRMLEPIPARTAFWFALVSAFPEVELYAAR